MNEYGYEPSINPSWELLHPRMTMEMLGYLPGWLFPDDPRSAREQFHSRYISGWDPFTGFGMNPDGTLFYSGDPPMSPLAKCQFRDETIYFYQSSWVGIRQKDGSFEVCRMD